MIYVRNPEVNGAFKIPLLLELIPEYTDISIYN